MQARTTFYIGVFVTILGIVQFASSGEPMRLITVLVGIFFVLWGWRIGWTRYPVATTWLGHAAIVLGCFLSAYGLYQMPFLKAPPSVAGILDLPLFWGLFTLFGGWCMITHGYCACCIRRSRGSGSAGERGVVGPEVTETA